MGEKVGCHPCNDDMAAQSTQAKGQEVVQVYDAKAGTYKMSDGGKPTQATATLPNTPSPFATKE